MRKVSLFAVLFTVLLCVSISTASAQKLFWTSSGLAGPFDIRGLIPSYPESRDINNLPINMWILDHPKGLVLFDTGNNVAISDGQCKTHWAAGLCDFLKPRQTRDDVIDKKLEKLGYKIDDVKIVITSHSHLDHIGNIEMFPKAIHVIQKKELYQAWWPEKFQRGGAHVLADYDDARDFNYLELNGDYDLFGDGSVIVLSTPGHTMGHQSLKVKLPEAGTVILSADAIWMEENLEGYPAGINYSILDYTNSLNRLKMMADIENAKLWFGHSGKQYEAMGEKWYK